jgi:hypothetical protein
MILTIVLGLALWVFEAISNGFSLALATSFFLLLCNALQSARLFSRLGFTNLISPFVAITYFLLASCLMLDHTAWQGQLYVLGLQTIIIVLCASVDHQEMIEQSFLCTLIAALLVFVNPLAICLLLLVWILLLLRRAMSLRVFLASLIALALVLIYSALLHYLGWATISWHSLLDGWWELPIFLSCGVFLLLMLVAWLPIRRPTIASGIIHYLFLLAAITTYLLTSLS